MPQMDDEARRFGHAKRLLAALSPDAYRWTRKIYLNTMGHARWLRRSSVPQAPSPYDTGFWDHHDAAAYEIIAQVLIETFQPQSWLDVGCGSGRLLQSVQTLAPQIRRMGLESSPEALKLCAARDVPVKDLDVARASRRELSDLARNWGRFDLVTCFEVAEHLPVWHSGKLVEFLTATAEALAFSAAQPGQGGTLHMNEQPPEYWVRRMVRNGFIQDSLATRALQEKLSQPAVPPWYAANLCILHRNAQIT